MPKFEMDNLFEFVDRARGKTWQFRMPLFSESEALMKIQADGDADPQKKMDATLDFLAALMSDYHEDINTGEDVHKIFGMAEVNYYATKIKTWMETGIKETENPTQGMVESQKPSQKSSSD